MGSAHPSRFDPDRWIQDAVLANRDGGQAAVQELLTRALENPSSVLRAMGEPTVAGMHPLFRSEELSVFNVVWTPRMILVPHDHDMWVTIGIYTGREDNILWERREARITARGARSLSEREVFSFGAKGIHSVTNPIPRMTGAIHVYGGDLVAATKRSQWDPETLEEKPFSMEATRRIFDEANERMRRETEGNP